MSRPLKLTFTEPLLGTVTKDPEVYAAYIASRAALTDKELAEELSTVEKVEEKGWTGFHTLPDGTPILYDYVIKGFLKDACGMLRRISGSRSSKLRAYKKEIDGLVFVTPRQIPLILPSGPETVEIPLYELQPNPDYDPDAEHGPNARESIYVVVGSKTESTYPGMGILERPLRASTAQGDRVALARSDTCPPGTTLTFNLTVLGGNISGKLLGEWFDYGALRGLGQWRNASYGRFDWEDLSED